MKQLSFYGTELFQKEEKKPVKEIEPFLRMSEELPALKKGCYVRMKQGGTYRIEGMEKPQDIVTGYEFRTTYDGERYKKKIYTTRERAYCYVYDNGKSSKYIIKQEDVVKQSLYLIDLIYKGDFVITRDYGMQYIEHKHVGKVVDYETYETDACSGQVHTVIKQKVQTYLLCDNARKILYEEDLVSIVTKPKFDYAKYLEKGMKIKCGYWGWVEVQAVMHKKILCSSQRSSQPFFVYFDDILDMEEIEM